MEDLLNLFWLALYGCIAFGAVRLMYRVLGNTVRGAQQIAKEAWEDTHD